MKKKFIPLFLYVADFMKLLNSSERTAYREMKKVKAYFNLRDDGLISIYHYSEYRNIPVLFLAMHLLDLMFLIIIDDQDKKD